MTVIHDNPLIIIQMNIVAQSPWSVFLSVSIMKVAQPCLTLCDPIGCSWPGSSVHGILHARILEWGSLLQGVVPTQGSNPGLPHCRRVLYHLSHQGSPITGLRSPSCSLQKGCGDSGSGVVLAISLSELLDLTRNLSSCKRFVCPSHVTQPWITSLFPMYFKSTIHNSKVLLLMLGNKGRAANREYGNTYASILEFSIQ